MFLRTLSEMHPIKNHTVLNGENELRNIVETNVQDRVCAGMSTGKKEDNERAQEHLQSTSMYKNIDTVMLMAQKMYIR